MVNLETLEIILPAAIAGLMVAILHVPLGIEVLRRGIIFIDLAIAQIAGLCVVLVKLWAHDASWGTTQIVAILAALIAALFFRWVEKTAPQEQEAIIGSSFILGGEEVQHILSGQILFVSWDRIIAFAPIYFTGLILWFALPAIRQGAWFFVLFAVVVTSSVQLVGVYVVFASLILPALAVNKRQSTPIAFAMILSAVSVIGGIALSAIYDVPAGPLLVFAFAAITIVTRLISRGSASH